VPSGKTLKAYIPSLEYHVMVAQFDQWRVYRTAKKVLEWQSLSLMVEGKFRNAWFQQKKILVNVF